MIEEEKIIAIISQKLSGSLSAEDETQLDVWLAVPKNAQAYQEYQVVWESTANVANKQEHYQPNTAKAWQSIEQEITLKPKRKFKLACGAAAAVALLLVVLGGNYFFNTNSNKVEIVLQANENDTLTFSDGSQAYLFGPCSISYPQEFAKQERFVSMEGFAYFDIAHEADRSFEIKTARGTVEVLGTSFTVDTRQDDVFAVQCITGRVRVTGMQSNQKDEAILTRHQKAVYTSSTNQIEVAPLVTEDAGLLIPSREMSFSNQPLGKILERIEYNFDVSIQLENKDLLQTKYSTTLNDSTLDDFLNELEVTFKVEVIQESPSNFILKGGNLN